MAKFWQAIWHGPLTSEQQTKVERMVTRSGYERQTAEYELRTQVTASPDKLDVAALRSYAIEYGPQWKDSLMLDWYNARLSHCDSMPERGTILHGIRNNMGNAWLAGFEFDSPIEFPNMRRCSANELGNILAALSLHPWNNTEAETIRLWAARRERRRRVMARSNPR